MKVHSKICDFLRFAVKPLVGMDKDKLYKVLHDIVKNSIMPVVYPGAKRAIKFHNDRNDTVVIVTSTMDYLAEHIAEQLNINYVIASPMDKKMECSPVRLVVFLPFKTTKLQGSICS